MPENDLSALQGQVLRFRTGAAMPSRLGSQQLRDEFTAVLELVKNSYDADATEVRVEFRDVEGNTQLLIQDNGSGMTLDDLHTKWAWLATENKLREDRSPIHSRPRLGQKGVGRFAAEKLGRRLVLRTRTDADASVWQVEFSWDELEGARELADYQYPIKRKRPKPFEPPHGTTLIVRELRIRWVRSRVERLRAQLSRLIDPETASTDFKIHLYAPWPDLSGPLVNPLPGNETHRLEFSLEADGRETVRIFQNGKQTHRTSSLDPPIFGPVRGRLRYFRQGLPASERARGGDPDQDWNVGVRIFRDGCRVRPYGEPGPEGDWLQIYRARARYYIGGTLFRLRPQYLEGTVHITRHQNPDLRDTTSREGVETNEAYEAFVEYVKRKLGSLSDLISQEEQREERSRTQQRYSRALRPLAEGLNKVRSDEYRHAVESSDAEVRRGLRRTGILPPISVIRNAHWECLDCGDSWKVPIDQLPTRCRDLSVGRDGNPTNKPGCGSTNIRRKENVPREGPAPQPPSTQLDDVLAGMPAVVSGVVIKPIIDWEMGEQDEEAEVRPERRELAINGRHPAFRAADRLDGNRTVEGTSIEDLGAVAALAMHVIGAASHAWGRLHFGRSGGKFEQYEAAMNRLKAACLSGILEDKGNTAQRQPA
jgi:anti-sigma regulatory factor (Ser/Thr protein kinase)